MKRLELTSFPPLDYACSESLNTLCTNLSFTGSGVKKIMISSCRAGEGKTFMSMNILRTFAGLGKNVVLVDADLRRSSIASKYGVRFLSGEVHGLAHYLAGMCDMDDVVYETNIEGVHMVPIGKKVSNSLSLLNTKRLSQLLDSLAASFDLVLIDTSPIGIIVDAAEVAKSCDGALLVASYNNVTRGEMREAKLMLDRAGCEVLGAVLNKVTFNTLSSRKYYHYKYHSREYYKPARNQAQTKKNSTENGVSAK